MIAPRDFAMVRSKNVLPLLTMSKLLCICFQDTGNTNIMTI